jgi:hypothetical protein
MVCEHEQWWGCGVRAGTGGLDACAEIVRVGLSALDVELHPECEASAVAKTVADGAGRHELCLC